MTLPEYRELVDKLGGLNECARLLGISKTTLYYRRIGKTELTVEMCLAIKALWSQTTFRPLSFQPA
jgi:DNA-binding transcriptional regulator YdaS (Cro superfamily)